MAAAAAAFDVLDFWDGDVVDLVGGFALMTSLENPAPAFVYGYCECGKLAVAAAAAGTIVLHCMVTFWTPLILFRVWVSLTMTHFVCIADFVVGRDIPGQWQCGNCAATRCWPVRRNCCRCGAPQLDNPPTAAPWNAGKNKGRNKGPYRRDSLSGPNNVPPTVDRQGLGRGRRLSPRILLRRLMTCLERSSFFRESFLQRTSPSMRRWCCLRERNVPRSESSCSGKRFNLRTDCGSKRLVMLNRLLSLKLMQRSNGLCFKVREQLEAVNSPSGQPPEPPPLPAPRTPPPPQSQDLLDIVRPPDQDMEN